MRRIRFLSSLSDVSELPTEFRIFKAGRNDSTQGPVWFDVRSAQLVMAQAGAHDVDHMIDLEHYSINSRAVDEGSTDRDARGWYRPQLRAGDLWASGVSWTDDGALRLRERRQRYTSPAFMTEFDQSLDGGKGGDRVTELLNVALCSMPATHGCEALVRTHLDTGSASGYAPVRMTDRDAMAACLAALQSGDVQGAMAALETQLATPPEAEGAAEGEPAMASDAQPAAEEEPAPEDRPEVQEYTQLRAALCAAAGVADPADAVRMLGALVSERVAAEAAERRALVTALIDVGAETPATAWTNGAPVSRLAGEALPELRARVAALRTARGTAPAHTPPQTGATLADLSEVEQAAAAQITDVAKRDAFVALRRSRKIKAR